MLVKAKHLIRLRFNFWQEYLIGDVFFREEVQIIF